MRDGFSYAHVISCLPFLGASFNGLGCLLPQGFFIRAQNETASHQKSCNEHWNWTKIPAMFDSQLPGVTWQGDHCRGLAWEVKGRTLVPKLRFCRRSDMRSTFPKVPWYSVTKNGLKPHWSRSGPGLRYALKQKTALSVGSLSATWKQMVVSLGWLSHHLRDLRKTGLLKQCWRSARDLMKQVKNNLHRESVDRCRSLIFWHCSRCGFSPGRTTSHKFCWWATSSGIILHKHSLRPTWENLLSPYVGAVCTCLTYRSIPEPSLCQICCCALFQFFLIGATLFCDESHVMKF